MENDELLDMSTDILVPSSQREDSPTFSRKLINRLGISSSQRGSETVTETQTCGPWTHAWAEHLQIRMGVLQLLCYTVCE